MTMDDEGRGDLSLFEREDDFREPSRRRVSRSSRPEVQIRRSRRRRVRGRIVPVIAIVIIAVVVVAGYGIVRHVADSFAVKDYKGSGTGAVVIEIPTGDTTAQIATILLDHGVIASTRAFVNAADNSDRSQDLQSGYFRVHVHMSGKAALAALLNPNARLGTSVTIPEGLTMAAILVRLSKQLKLSPTALKRAAAGVKQLGIPPGFVPARGSAEGFLFPSTYFEDPHVSATKVLQDMVGQFQNVTRNLHFVAAAKKLHLTAYQVLIIASMVEAEANNDVDRSRVAQVVYNRLKAKMPLGFDSTSAYGARLLGQNPININYNKPAPYNTRLKPGLPPTPIDNPGQKSMAAAIAPTKGNWLYFVSKDAAGHLFFTNSAKAFNAAKTKCRTHHWGCV